MFLINDILVSDELLEEKFCCDLGACKGACCVQGDFGAPLEPEERDTLREIYKDVLPVLDKVGRQTIQELGVDTYFPGMNDHGTTLRPDGACVFTVFDENGMASCGIEKQYEAGIVEFKKPLSCELYPIRVMRNPETGFTALNFDRWKICQPATVKGNALGLPVIHFLKNALIRAYGEEFYDALDAARIHHESTVE
ncbi:DUF3109 family protein [Membranicola marinus]|uniref:DUF3109 family protein n=1 Tax=Membranihabitans marinus TaxID=1227546 RepID=A0A953LE15_9BACT|nr:DUF3109 family protein [Membranihabitans marinus]MBY5959474.1 DUF3109 family protein [Membranihabitans marinus]